MVSNIHLYCRVWKWDWGLKTQEPRAQNLVSVKICLVSNTDLEMFVNTRTQECTFSHNWCCLWVRNVMWDIFRFNTCKITYDVTLWYLCLELPVEFIVYFFKIGVLMIMWEKECDTRCLLKLTVLKLVQFYLARQGLAN